MCRIAKAHQESIKRSVFIRTVDMIRRNRLNPLELKRLLQEADKKPIEQVLNQFNLEKNVMY